MYEELAKSKLSLINAIRHENFDRRGSISLPAFDETSLSAVCTSTSKTSCHVNHSYHRFLSP